MVDRLLPVESSGCRESERPELSSLDQVYVILQLSHCLRLFCWYGLDVGMRLERLDEVCPLLMVLFCSLAVVPA